MATVSVTERWRPSRKVAGTALAGSRNFCISGAAREVFPEDRTFPANRPGLRVFSPATLIPRRRPADGRLARANSREPWNRREKSGRTVMRNEYGITETGTGKGPGEGTWTCRDRVVRRVKTTCGEGPTVAKKWSP